MDSPLPLPEAEDTGLRLPAHGTTVTADGLRARLIAAMDQDDAIEIDASQVESVGQAVLQVLVAARSEAVSAGLDLSFLNPSQAFVDRVNACRLGTAIGLETGDVQ